MAMNTNAIQQLSIHASAKEATLISNTQDIIALTFNPRLREGGDLIALEKSKVYSAFNPRLREGGDQSWTKNHIAATHFQSTPPRRRRLGAGVANVGTIYAFNPRLREGGDLYRLGICKQPPTFNPRLREGGDSFFSSLSSVDGLSIHASAKEATKFPILADTLKRGLSIHASAKEATATYCNTPAIMCISSLNNFFVHHF